MTHKYIVRTTSTSGSSASIAVDTYIDGDFDNSFNMPYSTYSNVWKNFDDLIRIQYNSSTFSWVVEILGDIEDYEVGDTISWVYNTSVNYEFNEVYIPPVPVGAFVIELMNNKEELNKISKSPELVISLSGNLKDEANIVDPEILIAYDGVLVNCNYMHIPILNRYYFINKIDSVRTGLWRVTAHCDVLKTYSEALLGTECVVARSENRYNLYLNDSMFKVYSNPRLQIANFPKKFTGQSYVLVMNGANYT